mgnify:CR=1 FL=1|tara:strand:- start:67 stop:357 length:291 start_codon:yes stop_codon:yes gene_type:complete
MSKRQRRYVAIQNLEDGIRAYCFLDAVLENYTDEDHQHVKLTRFVVKATLNELIDTYHQRNGSEALEEFSQRLSSEAASTKSSDDSKDERPAEQSV